VDLQHDLEAKTEEVAKEVAGAGKKVFAFLVQAEAELLKGTFNIATFIPKNILSGLCENSDEVHRGKQSMQQLVGSGAKLDNIPINAENSKDFQSVARKYGIDYSLKKAVGGEKPQYLVFFKAKDVKVLTAAFKEYSAKVVEREGKKTIKERIKQDRAEVKAQNRERKREKKREEVL
jgi:hypothetical protein